MVPEIPQPTPRELILVAEPEAGLRARREKIISVVGAEIEPLVGLLASVEATMRPLFGVSEEWLKRRMTPSTNILMDGGQAPDLSIFYKITAPDHLLEWLTPRLRELSTVKAAYIKPGAEPPIIDHGIELSDGLDPGEITGDFSEFQVYLNPAAEGGIDVCSAWEMEGGRGAGVNIVDVEGAWRFSHEDLLENQSGVIGGIPIAKRGWRNHGTAVIGIISGDPNDFGITGICPDANLRAISVFGDSAGGPVAGWSSAAAIRLAADALQPGDIMLIELHRPGPRANFKERDDERGYIPVEWWPCDMAAIRYATSRGIIVVEAGGNGNQNLSDDIYDQNPTFPNGPFPAEWRNPFRRDPIDTGAILVGAGAPPLGINGSNFGPARSRMRFSNFSSGDNIIMDTQGWGEEVATCGYGGLSQNNPDEDRWYTRRFNGTSSAAPMIAGALGCLQGALKARGQLLTPTRARELFRTIGSEQQDAPQDGLNSVESHRIGPLPDLRRMLDILIPPP
ncbi:MAG TPA: S8 family serine peptidase [Pyrinomonadaceae bacterium]|jgi:hypothetical protein|nr:S8 family serine peptidase [Pyrinomonadaceae bacterium]